MTRIAILSQSGEPQLEKLAEELSLPLIEAERASKHDFVLLCDNEHLELREGCALDQPGVWVDFSQVDLRTGSGNLSKRQPLAKAMGPRAHTLLDATAGLGQDAFLLACIGFQVTAVERSPVLSALLQDALERAEKNAEIARVLGGRLHLLHGDSLELLRNPDREPDVVYLDPMFPPRRKKSALAKKPIRMVRSLVGDSQEDSELLTLALECARYRVVVKRHKGSEPLPGKAPSLHYAGKLVRYDVYETHRPAPKIDPGFESIPGEHHI